jgi:putative ABC transport system permease protein
MEASPSARRWLHRSFVGGTDPLVATVAAFFAGMVAGYVTGLLHTRLRVTELLAGILVMTALYSVNLHVMGRSNISLLDRATLATRLHAVAPSTAAWSNDISFGVVFFVLMLILGVAFAWFLRTDFGTAMRASGDNPAMITAQGVDRRGMVGARRLRWRMDSSRSRALSSRSTKVSPTSPWASEHSSPEWLP